jgi:hypothetical protein
VVDLRHWALPLRQRSIQRQSGAQEVVCVGDILKMVNLVLGSLLEVDMHDFQHDDVALGC